MLETMIAIHEQSARGNDLTRDALIRYYCVAHKTAVPGRSPVTIHRRAWAYCVAGGSEGHEWMPIEPTNQTDLRWFGPMFAEHDG